jgi:DHA2 family multidrug resistance protein
VATASADQNWKPKVNPWIIAATVALAAFMEVLDTSIANVALPHIAGNLGASSDEGTWVLTSYLISNAIVLPLGAWASSVIGRKRFFLTCIAIFTVSSFLCGISFSLPMLLICRVVQGAGGGGLQPMAQAIMADSFDEKKRGQAFALYALVTVLAPSIGPTVGGWITDNYSWRWIFYINIPVGILATVLVMRFVEDPPWIKATLANFRKLDYIGLGLLTVAMGGMQIMLDKGEENDWLASNFIRVFALLFAAGMIGLIWREWQSKNPIMNLKLFKFKNFAICAFLMLLVGGLLNASTVLQPQFSQQLLGYTATVAGEALTGGGLVLLVLAPLSGIASDKFSARKSCHRWFRLLCLRLLLQLHPPQPDHEFRLRFLAADAAGGCHSGLLYRHHERRIRGPAKRSQQSGLGDHQLREECGRQHLYRSYWSYRNQSFAVSPKPAGGPYAGRESSLYAEAQCAHQRVCGCERWPRGGDDGAWSYL